jgi:hypothetical protein
MAHRSFNKYPSLHLHTVANLPDTHMFRWSSLNAASVPKQLSWVLTTWLPSKISTCKRIRKTAIGKEYVHSSICTHYSGINSHEMDYVWPCSRMLAVLAGEGTIAISYQCLTTFNQHYCAKMFQCFKKWLFNIFICAKTIENCFKTKSKVMKFR